MNDLRLCLQVRNAQKAGATGAIIAGQWVVDGWGYMIIAGQGYMLNGCVVLHDYMSSGRVIKSRFSYCFDCKFNVLKIFFKN